MRFYRLGRVPCQSKLQRKIAGTSSWPSWISHFTGSFVGHSPSEMLCPPALFKKGEEGRKRKEVLHLSRCYTHTPGRAGETLKGKRKKKADTRRADGQKQRRGGRGTDGPPEPTYTARRTWQKQSTHLNPTTHYGEASRRVIRDQWGLVGEKRKQQNRIQFLTTYESCVIPLPGPWSSLALIGINGFQVPAN